MSTSIHPAFRLSPDLDLMGFADRLRAALTPQLVEKFQRIVVEEAVRSYDEKHEEGSVLGRYTGKPFAEFLSMYAVYLSSALFGTDDGIFDKHDLRSLRNIADANGVILRNPVRGDVYVLLSGSAVDGEAAESDVLNVEGVISDYSYWNSSDAQVEWLGEVEWRDRGKAWEETLDYAKGIPEQGLVVKFFSSRSSYDLLDWHVFEGRADLLPEMVEEARFRRIVFNRYMGALGKACPDMDMMFGVFDALSFMNTNNDCDYSILPAVEKRSDLLEAAVQAAEERISGFPITF